MTHQCMSFHHSIVLHYQTTPNLLPCTSHRTSAKTCATEGHQPTTTSGQSQPPTAEALITHGQQYRLELDDETCWRNQRYDKKNPLQCVQLLRLTKEDRTNMRWRPKCLKASRCLSGTFVAHCVCPPYCGFGGRGNLTSSMQNLSLTASTNIHYRSSNTGVSHVFGRKVAVLVS